MLLQAHYRGHICDTSDARVEHVGARGGPEHSRAICFTFRAPFVKHL